MDEKKQGTPETVATPAQTHETVAEFEITKQGKDRRFPAIVGKKREFGRDIDTFKITMSDIWQIDAEIEPTSKPLIDLCPNDTYYGKLVDGTKKKKENQYIAVLVLNGDGDNVGGYGFTDNEKKALCKMGLLRKVGA